MLIGAHVSSAGGLLPAVARGSAIGAEVIQVHPQSPRVWSPPPYDDEVLAAFARGVEEDPTVLASVCHASYLVNLATRDADLLAKSRACLVRNIEVATKIGALGLVLHLGSHLGSGFSAVVAPVAGELTRALDAAAELAGGETCPILMENTAGSGATIGRTFAELGRVLDAASGDGRLGVCLDTQHLFASGCSYGTLEEADGVLVDLDREVGLARLGCIHLNDSKVPLGANRDRHENLGEGLIGRRALAALVGHPALEEVPAVLEVPGRERRGPSAQDIRTARRIRAAGVRRWRSPAAPAATPPPPPAPRPTSGGRRGSPRGRAPSGSR